MFITRPNDNVYIFSNDKQPLSTIGYSTPTGVNGIGLRYYGGTGSPNSGASSTSNPILYSSSWTIPTEAVMLHIMCIGAGGGGGGGATRAAGVTGNGGAGGRCGHVMTAMFSTAFFPESLYITVGTGGAGGAAQSNGAHGSHSFVSVSDGSRIVQGVGGVGGGGGTTTVVGQAFGGYPPVGPRSSMVNYSDTGILFAGGSVRNWSYLAGLSFTPVLEFSNYTNIGQPGGGGGGTTAGSGVSNSLISSILNQTLTNFDQSSGLVTHGTGGAGMITTTAYASGGIYNAATADGLLVAGASAGGIRGNDGIFSLNPFYSTGGTGGSSINTAVGGAGGNGSYGGGGGGGAAGTTGGAGGKGGDGLIIITCLNKSNI